MVYKIKANFYLPIRAKDFNIKFSFEYMTLSSTNKIIFVIIFRIFLMKRQKKIKPVPSGQNRQKTV